MRISFSVLFLALLALTGALSGPAFGQSGENPPETWFNNLVTGFTRFFSPTRPLSEASATSEVIGGPPRLIGRALTYPSPFSIKKQGQVTIQFELSSPVNIDLFLYGAEGEIIKKFILNNLPAGLNKIRWNGRLDSGGLIGNGVYVGTIVSRDENKALGKFKLSVFD